MPRASIDRFEQRKQTRAKLIDAALRLFSTSGYDRSTVDDISQAAGYSKGAYYFHFSTKDDILLELLRMWTEDRNQVLEAHAGDDEESLRSTLEAFFSYPKDSHWYAVMLEFWAQGVRNEEVSRRLTQAYAGWRKVLAESFARVAAGGSINIESAEDAASVALAAHDGHAVQIAIGSPGGRTLTPAELADSLLGPLTAAATREHRSIAL